ncbi:MAG: hypothetical protein AAGC68_00815 [Verrucomicrobiota bacterium]
MRSLLIPIICSAFLCLVPPLLSDEEKAKRIGLIFEGAFESAELHRKPEGAQKTILVPFYEWDYGVRAFTKETWKEQAMSWERVLPAAEALADKVAEQIEPELVRDHRDIIQYAIVADKDPFLSSVLLSPRFLGRFRDTLGDRLQVVIVDRHQLFVFPATGGKIAEFGPALVDAFRQTSLPVSLEVFLVDRNGSRVIGEITREEN